MKLLAADSVTCRYRTGNLARCAGLLLVALLGAKVTLLITWIASLIVGWMLAATLITELSSAAGLACQPPGLNANFHALSRFGIQVQLDNLSRRWPALCLLVDFVAITDGRPLVSPPHFLGQLPPRQTAEFAWALTAHRRGPYDLATLRVRTAFPGSLYERVFIFGLGQRMVALPALYELVPRAHQLLIGRRRAAGRLQSNPAAMEEFVGTRDYRAGDNPRHIHLALSLRCPDYPVQLVVREFEDPSDEDVSIVLDSAIPTDASDHLLAYRYEKSLCFSLALCRLLAERKYRVRFLAVDGEGRLDLQIARPQRDMPVLEARLGQLLPVPERAAVYRLLEEQSRRSNSAVLFVSQRETPEERLQPRLSVLTLTPQWQMSLVERVVGV